MESKEPVQHPGDVLAPALAIDPEFRGAAQR
jgi:hypothetical protein